MLSEESEGSWQLRSADCFFVGGGCCRLLTAYCRLFFGWVRLESGQEVAGFWGLGLEVGFYVVNVDCGGWVGGGAPGGDADHEVVGEVADEDSRDYFKLLCLGDVCLEG